MKVNPIDLALNLVKADVVKPLETGTVDGLDAVIWHKKMFLPPHEDVLLLLDVFDRGQPTALAALLQVRPERCELAPVVDVV